ncbi:hypothetical protein ACIF8W_02540 [Streptomyces sp. NPDC085639]|uniref:hypothetical protein n=1 Tax=Streptomyces sp. NPDC085639 TaxID=3365734 RepID=UPI0037D48770
MTDNNCEALPVLGSAGRLVGLLTASDIVAALVRYPASASGNAEATAIGPSTTPGLGPRRDDRVNLSHERHHRMRAERPGRTTGRAHRGQTRSGGRNRVTPMDRAVRCLHARSPPGHRLHGGAPHHGIGPWRPSGSANWSADPHRAPLPAGDCGRDHRASLPCSSHSQLPSPRLGPMGTGAGPVGPCEETGRCLAW